MADFTVNLSRLTPDAAQAVIKGLQHEDRARYALGVLEQLKMKRMMDYCAVPGFNTQIGPAKMVLSEDQWLRVMQRYGQKCFLDPDLPQFLLKRHEEYRVKDVGTRVQSGWTPDSGKALANRRTDA